MYQGQTLQALATEISRQKETRKDFLAPASKLRFAQEQFTEADSNGEFNRRNRIVLAIAGKDGVSTYQPNENFNSQLAEYLRIPMEYYRRMESEVPDLLVASANAWLDNKAKIANQTAPGAGQRLEDKDERRLVRTLDGKARAFLSPRYQPLDNDRLVEAILPVLLRENKFELASCNVTDQRLDLKVHLPRIQGQITVGDTVNFGLAIRNSEVGNGSLAVELMAYRLSCSNGLITEKAVRKYHVGRQQNSLEGSWEVFSDATRQLTDKTFWNQLQDTMRATVAKAEENFDGLLNKLRKTTQIALPKPVEAVEVIQERFGLNDEEGSGILEQLIKGGDISLWGLTNAVTAYAQDNKLTYGRATELEAIGGKVIELTAKDLVLEAA